MELYICVCALQRGRLLFLPNQLLGKLPVNIWVLRNINCDGSYQYLGIISGLDRYYQQVECAWNSALPWRHTVRKFKKMKQNKTNLYSWTSQALSETSLLLAFTGETQGQPQIHEMDAPTWSHGHLQHVPTCPTIGLKVPCQQPPL